METTFDAFMEGWRDAEWSKVRSNMQITGNHYGFNEQKLSDMLGTVKPIDWAVISTDMITPVMCDVVAHVTFDGTLHKEMHARMVRESAPFTPDENGTWGVAPLSVLTIGEITGCL
jgi:hypothetical protein